MSSNDYIIENGKLIAYIGQTIVNELTIPDGVTEIGQCIFQEKITGDISLNISSSVKIIDDFAFCVKGGYKEERNKFNPRIIDFIKFDFGCRVGFSKVNIPKDSVLEKIGDYALYGKTDELFIPKTLISIGKFSDIPGGASAKKAFNIKKLVFDSEINLQKIDYLPCDDIVRVPRSLMSVQGVTANLIVIIPKGPHIESIDSQYVFTEKRLLDDDHKKIYAKYVLDNIDIETINYVDKLKECGYSYIETSKGLILTKLDNKVAKFNDIPTKIDGKTIWINNLIDPLDVDNESEKENLGDLYTKLKFFANKKKDNIIDSINKVRTKFKRIYYEYCPAGVIGKTAKAEMKGMKPALMFIVGGIIGFIIGIIVLYLNRHLNFFTPVFFALSVAVCLCLIEHLIISKYCPINVLKRQQKKGMFEEIYLHSSIMLLDKLVRETHDKESEFSALIDRILHGTAEEQRQKRIENELSELNKNLRNSNSPSSYDVYTNDGEHIGRIDKR